MFSHSRVFSFNMAFFVEIIYIYVIQIFLPDSINRYSLDIFWLFSSVIDCPMKRPNSNTEHVHKNHSLFYVNYRSFYHLIYDHFGFVYRLLVSRVVTWGKIWGSPRFQLRKRTLEFQPIPNLSSSSPSLTSLRKITYFRISQK